MTEYQTHSAIVAQLDRTASELQDTCHKQAQRMAVLEQAARRALEALEAQHVEHFMSIRVGASTALREALDYPKQDLDPAARNGWAPREVLFVNGEPVGHREPQPAALIAAEEREACAQVCVEISKDYWMGDCQFEAATRCAAAIRARNTK